MTTDSDAFEALRAALPTIVDDYEALIDAQVDDDTADRQREIAAAMAAIEREELDLWQQKQAGLDEGLWRRLSDDVLTRRRRLEDDARTLAGKARKVNRESLPVGGAARAIADDPDLLDDPDRLRLLVVNLFERIGMRQGPRDRQRFADPVVTSARLVGGVDWPL